MKVINPSTLRLSFLIPLFGLCSCVDTYTGPTLTNHLATQDQTAQTEEQDRVARFARLADQNDISRPSVHEVILPPGSVDFMTGPVPVVRVVFDERAFFAFDSAVPLPASSRIFDVIAQNMKHDVPDAMLTVLGHTDAVGTDDYNIDLSRRRAQAVMQELVNRGVSPGQLTEVAIGKRQPIAPNDTSAGRAMNRRVEFLVSPALASNLAAVQQYVAPASFFQTRKADDVTARRLAPEPAPAAVAMVLGMKATPIAAAMNAPQKTEMQSLGGLPLSPASQEKVQAAALSAPEAKKNVAEPVKLAMTMPVAPVKLIPPTQVTARELGTSNITY